MSKEEIEQVINRMLEQEEVPDWGVKPFHDALEEFLNHPWQEDAEIELVQLIREYWDDPELRNVASDFWKSYLKRVYQKNKEGLLPRVSDEFIIQFEELVR